MKEILIVNGTNDKMEVYPSKLRPGEPLTFEYVGNCIEIQKGELYKFLLDGSRDQLIDRLIIRYSYEKYYNKQDWDPFLAKYGVAVAIEHSGKNILVTTTEVIGDAVRHVTEIEDIYININGEWINKRADISAKEQLLTKKGATITKNPDGSRTISGYFFVEQENVPKHYSVDNTGTMSVDSFPLIYKFQNCSTSKLHINPGSADIFPNTAVKKSRPGF